MFKKGDCLSANTFVTSPNCYYLHVSGKNTKNRTECPLWTSWCWSHCPPGFSPSSASPEVLVGVWWSLIRPESLRPKPTAEPTAFNWTIRTVCPILLLDSSSSQTCWTVQGSHASALQAREKGTFDEFNLFFVVVSCKKNLQSLTQSPGRGGGMKRGVTK